MKLNMTVEVADSVDPTRTDPHEIGEDLIAVWDAERRVDPLAPAITFVGAHWVE